MDGEVMKQIYLIRASGERMGPYEYSPEISPAFPIKISSCARLSERETKALGFEIQYVEDKEDKPVIKRRWYVIRPKFSSGPWYTMLADLGEAADRRSYNFDVILDPTRTEAVETLG